MSRKGRRPHYPLKSIKAAFNDLSRLNRTMTATAGAEDLGIDDQVLIDIIAGLTANNFNKSMPSERDPMIWQDVYKTVFEGRELYMKFTSDSQGELLLISFKENWP